MRLRWIAALALAGQLAGCVVHLDSAIPDEMGIEDPGLVGTWVASAKERAVITHRGDNEYFVTYVFESDKARDFHATLGRLGGRTVLEIFPALDAEDRTAWPMGRLLLVIERTGDAGQVQALNHSALKEFVATPEGSMPTLESGDYFYLAAPTALLAARLEAFLQRADALDPDGPDDRWRRAPEPR